MRVVFVTIFDLNANNNDNIDTNRLPNSLPLNLSLSFFSLTTYNPKAQTTTQSGSSQQINQNNRLTQSKLKLAEIKRSMNGKNLTCVGVHHTLNQSVSVELDVQCKFSQRRYPSRSASATRLRTLAEKDRRKQFLLTFFHRHQRAPFHDLQVGTRSVFRLSSPVDTC